MFAAYALAIAAALVRAPAGYSDVLINMGYSCGPEPAEVVELTIPE